MPGFPISWEEGRSDQPIPSRSCPYSKQEIEKYLEDCQYHYAVHEPPLKFKADGPVLGRNEVGRNYWVCSAVDDLERQWFVLIGSGTSPFDPRTKMWRWMYAELNELDQRPDEFFDDAYAEQLMHDTRDH